MRIAPWLFGYIMSLPWGYNGRDCVTGLCVRGIHRWPVNSPHKRPVTRKMFPFDDVIMMNWVYEYIKIYFVFWCSLWIWYIISLSKKLCVYYCWKIIDDDVNKLKHFHVTGPLCGEVIHHRWIPLTKASDAELWCFCDLRLNKRFNKQSKRWWFETQ